MRQTAGSAARVCGGRGLGRFPLTGSPVRRLPHSVLRSSSRLLPPHGEGPLAAAGDGSTRQAGARRAGNAGREQLAGQAAELGGCRAVTGCSPAAFASRAGEARVAPGPGGRPTYPGLGYCGRGRPVGTAARPVAGSGAPVPCPGSGPS